MSCILLAGLYSEGISFLLPFVAHILSWATGGGGGSAGRLRTPCWRCIPCQTRRHILEKIPGFCVCPGDYSSFMVTANSWRKGSSQPASWLMLSLGQGFGKKRAAGTRSRSLSLSLWVLMCCRLADSHTLAIKHKLGSSQISLPDHAGKELCTETHWEPISPQHPGFSPAPCRGSLGGRDASKPMHSTLWFSQGPEQPPLKHAAQIGGHCEMPPTPPGGPQQCLHDETLPDQAVQKWAKSLYGCRKQVDHRAWNISTPSRSNLSFQHPFLMGEA